MVWPVRANGRSPGDSDLLEANRSNQKRQPTMFAESTSRRSAERQRPIRTHRGEAAQRRGANPEGLPRRHEGHEGQQQEEVLPYFVLFVPSWFKFPPAAANVPCPITDRDTPEALCRASDHETAPQEEGTTTRRNHEDTKGTKDNKKQVLPFFVLFVPSWLNSPPLLPDAGMRDGSGRSLVHRTEQS